MKTLQKFSAVHAAFHNHFIRIAISSAKRHTSPTLCCSGRVKDDRRLGPPPLPGLPSVKTSSVGLTASAGRIGRRADRARDRHRQIVEGPSPGLDSWLLWWRETPSKTICASWTGAPYRNGSSAYGA